MPSEKYSRRVSNLLIESIRIQKSRRRKLSSKTAQSARLVKEMVSEKALLLELQDVTRQKLVRKLHDGLSQTVSALAMRVNFARRMLDSDREAALQELVKVEDLARNSAKEIRQMIFILQPGLVESQGLSAGLDSLAMKMRDLFNLDVDLSLDQDFDNGLATNTQLVIYSIVEEAVDNARKHVGTERVWVKLNLVNGVVFIDIEDDSDDGTLTMDEVNNPELENMHKLAGLLGGTLEIDPTAGEGSRIQVKIPLSQRAFEEIVQESE
jgi:NarL family two-component system sensor histidine kinase LiaS